MADTYYAWSNFVLERDEWGKNTKVLEVGEEVTQQKLKVSDEDWEELKSVNAVRTAPYPDIPRDVSPREAARQIAAQGGELDELVALLHPVDQDVLDAQSDAPKGKATGGTQT